MNLDVKQIEKIIEQPTKTNEIADAEALQQRLRFFTEVHFSSLDPGMSDAYTKFVNWVEDIVTAKDKYHTFRTLFTLPNPAVGLVRKAYRDLSRVFDSRNSSSTYQFANSELLADWLTYREDYLHSSTVWREVAWKKMQTAVCSILVVDLPREQVTDRPAPYFYWLDITDVIDYQLKGRSTVELDWLVFKQPNNQVAAFDSQHIRVFQLDDENRIVATLVDQKHNLGYCPARFFWDESSNADQPSLKENPITKELSNLAWYLFFLVSKRQLDLYGSYPIYSSYAAGCDYENEDGDYCDGGFLRDVEGKYKVTLNGTPERCPVCSTKRLTGPGSHVEVPIPDPANGVADMRDPVTITSVDRTSLDYNVSETERLEREFRTSVAGEGGEVSEKEAINLDQIAANFESKTSVLLNLKTKFEKAQQFVESTICKYRYGEQFLDLSISWGTEFYIYTVAELRKIYTEAKAAGASSSELSMLSDLIVETQYKNNPLQFKRIKLLQQMEPYANKTEQELVNLYDKGLIDKSDFMLKLNFAYYIDRFERENTDILEFGKKLPLSKKIEIITKKLKEYVSEQETELDRQSIDGKPQGGADGSQGS